jgi:hypothetical protein
VRISGTSSATRGRPPRAAATWASQIAVGDAARVAAIRVWQRFADHDEPPPEYLGFSKDLQHLAANRASGSRSLANKACWRCQEDKLAPGQPHWECRFHGVNALAADEATFQSVPGTSRYDKRAPIGTRLWGDGPGPCLPPTPRPPSGGGGVGRLRSAVGVGSCSLNFGFRV